jgi:amino acid transporter
VVGISSSHDRSATHGFILCLCRWCYAKVGGASYVAQRAFGMVLPIKLVAIGLVFLVGCVISRGMRESMWLNIVCTEVEVSGLLFIIAVGLRFWGGVDYFETASGQHHLSGAGSGLTLALVLQGAVLMFFPSSALRIF